MIGVAGWAVREVGPPAPVRPDEIDEWLDAARVPAEP